MCQTYTMPLSRASNGHLTAMLSITLVYFHAIEQNPGLPILLVADYAELHCRQHFSLLFYGFGSKINLLELFAKEALTDGGVMAVYGHQPNMSAKQVQLDSHSPNQTHNMC